MSFSWSCYKNTAIALVKIVCYDENMSSQNVSKKLVGGNSKTSFLIEIDESIKARKRKSRLERVLSPAPYSERLTSYMKRYAYATNKIKREEDYCPVFEKALVSITFHSTEPSIGEVIFNTCGPFMDFNADDFFQLTNSSAKPFSQLIQADYHNVFASMDGVRVGKFFAGLKFFYDRSYEDYFSKLINAKNIPKNHLIYEDWMEDTETIRREVFENFFDLVSTHSNTPIELLRELA